MYWEEGMVLVSNSAGEGWISLLSAEMIDNSTAAKELRAPNVPHKLHPQPRTECYDPLLPPRARLSCQLHSKAQLSVEFARLLHDHGLKKRRLNWPIDLPGISTQLQELTGHFHMLSLQLVPIRNSQPRDQVPTLSLPTPMPSHPRPNFQLPVIKP